MFSDNKRFVLKTVKPAEEKLLFAPKNGVLPFYYQYVASNERNLLSKLLGYAQCGEADRGSSFEHFPSHFLHIEPATTQRQSHVKAAMRRTAPTFQIALTTNRLRERAPGYGGQTPPAHLPGVLGLHEEQSREELSS